jgi:hypothetical protein
LLLQTLLVVFCSLREGDGFILPMSYQDLRIPGGLVLPMADLEEDKLHAEIAKLHAETKNLNAAAEKDLKEGQKASEEALKLKIDSKNALRGMGYWWLRD